MVLCHTVNPSLGALLICGAPCVAHHRREVVEQLGATDAALDSVSAWAGMLLLRKAAARAPVGAGRGESTLGSSRPKLIGTMGAGAGSAGASGGGAAISAEAFVAEWLALAINSTAFERPSSRRRKDGTLREGAKPQDRTFVSHRHDQSVLSLLLYAEAQRSRRA